MRPSKVEYYLNIALAVAQRGTCLRRNYGAVIVNNDQIVGTGYTGAPRGSENCCDLESCKREDINAAPGDRYDLCNSVHAEANAIISAGRERCTGATMYVMGFDVQTRKPITTAPCPMCYRLLINSGIKEVVIPTPAEQKGDESA